MEVKYLEPEVGKCYKGILASKAQRVMHDPKAYPFYKYFARKEDLTTLGKLLDEKTTGSGPGTETTFTFEAGELKVNNDYIVYFAEVPCEGGGRRPRSKKLPSRGRKTRKHGKRRLTRVQRTQTS